MRWEGEIRRLKSTICYKRRPRDKLTGSNENLKLERLRFGESSDSPTTSAFAEATLSPNYLLNGDKSKQISDGENSKKLWVSMQN